MFTCGNVLLAFFFLSIIVLVTLCDSMTFEVCTYDFNLFVLIVVVTFLTYYHVWVPFMLHTNNGGFFIFMFEQC
jgi:hypothetical protein